MFITFEGIDGSGKTTQALKLKEWLEAQGREVLYTFEPGGCELCKGIRELLLSNVIKDNIARLILFLGDRKLHVDRVIAPALSAGKIVICDRYNYSTIAYQGAAGIAYQGANGIAYQGAYCANGLNDKLNYKLDYELNYKFVEEIVKSFNFIEPDIIFMLDIKAEAALTRMAGRDRDKDAIERSGEKYLSCVNKIYNELAANNAHVKLIDANKSELEIANLIRDYIKLKI